MSKRNVKDELLLPKSMKWVDGVMQWEKKGGHAGRDVCVRVMHAATFRNWKTTRDDSQMSQSGCARSEMVMTDGTFELTLCRFYGPVATENRFSIRVTEVKKSESV